MFRLYSKGCEYVIRALAQVNAVGDGKCFSVKEICEKADLPEWYTRKVFQALVREGLLKASRGPGGGYKFGVPPGKISILRMIQAIDGKHVLDQCIMGSGECKDRDPCPLHKKWVKIKAGLISQLRSVTIQELIGSMSRSDRGKSNFKEEGSRQ